MAGTEVLVVVCGGIAAYKVCTVVSRLVQRGAGVMVAMTKSARKLVGPATFQSLSGRKVLTSLWRPTADYDAQHIHVTERANLCIVAPATANIIGKITAGIADDLASTLLAGVACPVLLAPAMNTAMWENPFVQSNVARLKEAGYHLVGPGEGWLACRTVGIGRMAEPDEILTAATQLLKAGRSGNSNPCVSS
ncbi:MAG: phosphopantothenoylcysteine decarboxylase [Phycisphaerae bacterium]|nr:phosphopantothenoylcysteine decarboxylase [Phycisphaerae bacterium]